VRAIAGQRVQVERHRRDERLAFARRHFRDLAKVELDAAHQLDVVRHHVPLEVAPGDVHRGAEQAARRLAHRGERLGQDLVERVGDRAPQLALHAAAAVGACELVVEPLTLGRVGGRPLLLPQLGRRRRQGARPLLEQLAEFRGLAADLVIAHAGKPRLLLVDRVEDGLDPLQVPLVAGAQNGRQYALEHEVLYLYSRCSAI